MRSWFLKACQRINKASWLGRLPSRHDNAQPLEPLVFALAYEIQIELRVTQEEPILHMIIQITAVRPDMSRFQHV